MGGGTLQLVAYGGQDIHITGNPEISFFNSVYRRHTNFAMECIKQPMLGPIKTDAFKASFKLGRDGDLINKMHLEIKLPEQKNLLLTKGHGIINPTNPEHNMHAKYGQGYDVIPKSSHWKREEAIGGRGTNANPHLIYETDSGVVEDKINDTCSIKGILKNNILSHIIITNPGKNYKYGAKVRMELDGVDVLDTKFRAIINNENKIEQIIIIEKKDNEQYTKDTVIKIIITGECDPTLKNGDSIHDASLPKYGIGAQAIAVRVNRGISSIEMNGPFG